LAECISADEAELPQLKEARLAYSRDVISHAELLIKKYVLRGSTRLLRNRVVLSIVRLR